MFGFWSHLSMTMYWHLDLILYIYDMIWYDMIWYDMIWNDMIYYDILWYTMIYYWYLHSMCNFDSILCVKNMFNVNMHNDAHMYIYIYIHTYLFISPPLVIVYLLCLHDISLKQPIWLQIKSFRTYLPLQLCEFELLTKMAVFFWMPTTASLDYNFEVGGSAEKLGTIAAKC